MAEPLSVPTDLLGITREDPAWKPWETCEGSDTKEYSDMHFHNFRSRALSFQWTPPSVGSPSRLVAIDIYNGHKQWGHYPFFPIVLSQGEKVFHVQPTTKALEFVQVMGEPKRKGGGAMLAGPAMWMEWELSRGPSKSKLYVQVEFAGEAARSPDRWEPGRGSEATWGTMTLSLLPA